MKIVLTLLVVFLCIHPLNASENAAAFLDIKVGARATAMGGAYTAMANDATAVHWNPSALGRMHRFQLVNSVLNCSIGNQSTIDKISSGHYFLALAVPIPKIGTIGFGWKRFSLGDIEIRQDEDTAFGSFDDAENAFYIAWGKALIDRTLNVGMSLRIVRQEFSGIQGAQAKGVGFGLGVQCRLVEPLTLGICVEDDFQLKWQNGVEDQVPFKSRIGLAYSTMARHLTIAADLEQKRNWPLWGSVGAEYRISPGFLQTRDKLSFAGIAIRAGLAESILENRYPHTQFQEGQNLNGGFGLYWQEKNWSIQFDYAYGAERLGMRHRFTFTVGF